MKTELELIQLAQRKTEELHEFFEKHKTEKVDENNNPIFDISAEQLQERRDRSSELDTINEELEKVRSQKAWLENQARIADLKGVDRTTPRPAQAVPQNSQYQTRPTVQAKSLGEMVTDSNEYKFRNTQNRHFGFEREDVDLKTLISTAAGYAPVNARTPLVVDFANRRPMIADLIPSDPTTLQIVKWMENTTFTNAAASVSQGGVKPESALLWTERSSTVEKIATWIPVTEEQVDDVPGFQGIINRDLVLMIQLVEEVEILTGTGVSPHLTGILNNANIQTQAKGADDPQDAIFRAFTLVRWTGFAEPSGIVMHPNDWEAIRLLRTTDGLYIFGNPGDESVQRLWGKPVIVTTAMTENTALTGDFTMYSHISRKMGIRVDVADQHASYFISNLLVVRAEERISLEVKRGAAFAKITGI